MSPGPYLTLARKGFQRAVTYRAAFWSELAINLLFMTLYVYVWKALTAGRPSVAGFSRDELLDYIIVAQTAMTVQFTLRVSYELEVRVRSGAIALDLLRPIDVQGALVATAAGPATQVLLFNMVPKMAIFAVAGVLHAPASLGAAVLFPISLALAFGIQVGLELLVGLTAFWLLEVRGLHMAVFWGLGALCSGYYAPTALYPPWLAAIAAALPFRAIVETPASVWVGHAGVAAVAFQAAWVVALHLMARAVFAVGRRRLVVQGG